MEPFFQCSGTCPICVSEVIFSSHNSWFRDNLICNNCGSIPRERALMVAIEKFAPNWRSCVIHESSPAARGTSQRLKKEAPRYIETQFFFGKIPGSMVRGFRNENLENMTFANNRIDLHITQDVMEHVFDVDKAFAEIARTLKSGGMHIFTVPIVQQAGIPTVKRAEFTNGKEIHLLEPVYHGNPVSQEGSLVVYDWGYDIVQRIYEASKMHTIVLQMDDISRGIKAEYIDVLISVKG